MADVEEELERHRATFVDAPDVRLVDVTTEMRREGQHAEATDRWREVRDFTRTPCTLCGRRRPTPNCVVCVSNHPEIVRTVATVNGVEVQPEDLGGGNYRVNVTGWESALTGVGRSEPLNATERPRTVSAWVALARLAIYAHKHGGYVERENQGWRLRGDMPGAVYRVANGDQLDAALIEQDPGAEFTFAESMMLLWGERADELKRDGAHEVVPAARRAPCRACGASEGNPCTPLHEGERQPGKWCHPLRGVPTSPENDPGNPSTIKLAIEITENDALRSDTLRGLKPGVQEALRALSREVLAAHRLRKLGMEAYPNARDRASLGMLGVTHSEGEAPRWRDNNIETAIGEDLERLAELVGVERHRAGERAYEPDESLRWRAIAARNVQADDLYVETGVLTPDEAARSRFGLATPSEHALHIYRVTGGGSVITMRGIGANNSWIGEPVGVVADGTDDGVVRLMPDDGATVLGRVIGVEGDVVSVVLA